MADISLRFSVRINQPLAPAARPNSIPDASASISNGTLSNCFYDRDCSGARITAGGPSLPIVAFASDCGETGRPIVAGVARVGFEDVWNSVFGFCVYEIRSNHCIELAFP